MTATLPPIDLVTAETLAPGYHVLHSRTPFALAGVRLCWPFVMGVEPADAAGSLTVALDWALDRIEDTASGAGSVRESLLTLGADLAIRTDEHGIWLQVTAPPSSIAEVVHRLLSGVRHLSELSTDDIHSDATLPRLRARAHRARLLAQRSGEHAARAAIRAAHYPVGARAALPPEGTDATVASLTANQIHHAAMVLAQPPLVVASHPGLLPIPDPRPADVDTTPMPVPHGTDRPTMRIPVPGRPDEQAYLGRGSVGVADDLVEVVGREMCLAALGSGYLSVWNSVFRHELGVTYGVTAQTSARPLAGRWRVDQQLGFAFGPSHLHAVLARIGELLAGPDAAELDLALIAAAVTAEHRRAALAHFSVSAFLTRFGAPLIAGWTHEQIRERESILADPDLPAFGRAWQRHQSAMLTVVATRTGGG